MAFLYIKKIISSLLFAVIALGFSFHVSFAQGASLNKYSGHLYSQAVHHIDCGSSGPGCSADEHLFVAAISSTSKKTTQETKGSPDVDSNLFFLNQGQDNINNYHLSLKSTGYAHHHFLKTNSNSGGHHGLARSQLP